MSNHGVQQKLFEDSEPIEFEKIPEPTLEELVGIKSMLINLINKTSRNLARGEKHLVEFFGRIPEKVPIVDEFTSEIFLVDSKSELKIENGTYYGVLESIDIIGNRVQTTFDLPGISMVVIYKHDPDKFDFRDAGFDPWSYVSSLVVRSIVK